MTSVESRRHFETKTLERCRSESGMQSKSDVRDELRLFVLEEKNNLNTVFHNSVGEIQ